MHEYKAGSIADRMCLKVSQAKKRDETLERTRELVVWNRASSYLCDVTKTNDDELMTKTNYRNGKFKATMYPWPMFFQDRPPDY